MSSGLVCDDNLDTRKPALVGVLPKVANGSTLGVKPTLSLTDMARNPLQSLTSPSKMSSP